MSTFNADLFAKFIDMAIHQFQKWTYGCFVETIDSFRAVFFYFYKPASFKPAQMVRHEALLVAEFFCDIGGSVGLVAQEMNNVPARLIAKRFKKELMRLV